MPSTRIDSPEPRPGIAAGHDARPRALALIALYKLVKAVACTMLAAAAFDLVRPEVAAWFGGWLESLTWPTRHGFSMRAIDWLLGLGPHQFRLFGSAALVYAALYAVQGVGLWFGKRWAEYLVVAETSLLLPFEIWELLRRFSLFKLVVLVVNVAVIIYLIHLLRRRAPAEIR
ncbi:DUF2127 domain-containing protein [Dokdonella soli]|uniref:DUF2127 domain-containing protein n=1 Tax=Dokdonella soli TaxID=529810 RepID=A0ABP3THJ2_9GAMM